MSANAAPSPAFSSGGVPFLALANVGASALLAYWIAGPYWSIAAGSVAAFVFLMPWAFRRATTVTRTPPAVRPPRPRRFDRPNSVALFFCNVFMFVVLGILVFGMKFALAAALIATPIWLLVIVLLVARASDPDAAL